MRGKRFSAVRYGGRHLAAGRRATRRAAASSAEDRALAKLVICGVIFVMLVAIKLLFPETVSGIAQSAAQLIGRDVDFKEAFAAMGRAVSGEETVGDSLQDAYTAVFNPSPMSAAAERDETLTVDISELERPGMELLCFAVEPLAMPSLEVVREIEPEEIKTEAELASQAVSYTYIMPELPENASLEQRSLGFAYTSPVEGVLTSSFGWREHPITGGTRFHYGVDLAADTGTAVRAFADGEVYATGESSTLGKYVILTHAGGYRTLYAHCSSVEVTSGSVVMGEMIAKVGETGVATGPHLHFELQDGSLYLNPIYYVAVR